MSFVLYVTNNTGPTSVTSVGVNTFSTIVLLTLTTNCDGGALLATQHTHFCLILCLILRGGRVALVSPNMRRDNSRGHVTKHGLGVPNPNSRGHATKRGFRDCPGFLNSTGRLGPKRGRKCYVTLHSRGSPTKGTKSEVRTYARGHNDAPSISKYRSLVQPDAQMAALR